MDEGITYEVICRPFREMLHEVFFRGNAVSGMPLYLIMEFFWCRIFGFSEYALRSMNLVIAVLYLLAVVKLIRYYHLPSWSLLVFVFNPVFLYYMNEARPYVGMIVFGLWCFYCLCMFYENGKKRYLFCFFAWFWLGCAIHMMFVFMGIAYVCMILFQIRKHNLNLKHHILAWFCCFPLFIPLAILYIRLVFYAPELNAVHPKPLAGILQIIYFFAGLGGIGWSRNALRCMDLSASFRIYSGLFLSMLCYLAVFFFFVRNKMINNPKIRFLIICCGSVLFLFIVANVIIKTLFWERHISFILPAFVLLIVYVCADMLDGKNPLWIRISAVLMLILQCYSGISIMLLDYYQKDDYRGAVEAARRMNPDHILFEGHKETFDYYGLNGSWAENLSEDDYSIENVNISTASKDVYESILNRIQGRIVLILCEKEEFDALGLYRQLSNKGTRFHSFSVVLPDDADSSDVIRRP
ncbi:MAG: glycosyltransferase family 39 protein [Lachnospiraceae bacterium]|nr:glycosyltransferase family 39 protein [Lachnospiraceae bacterium]